MNLLSIGGSDPTSGAGIQNDVKLSANFNVNCFTVITAITGQNTSNFGMVEPVSINILKNQLDSIFSDFQIDVIKIGMVYNSKIIKFLYSKLKKLKIPIVVDPVIKSTTGGMLIEKSALNDFRKYLIPISTIITPNKFEAEIISGTKILSANSHESIAKKIQKMGAKNVIITGIEKNNLIVDFVAEKHTKYYISNKKIFKENHGGGCTFSAVIAFSLGNKKTIKEAVTFAHDFTINSIKNARKIGKGIPITNSSFDLFQKELADGIQRFAEIKNINQMIPECQTNFVYSKEKPKSIKDVLGVSGRIIKTDSGLAMAGDLMYGGSKHVATALITVNKKFPELKSAINIKYQEKTINKIKKQKFIVINYDRKLEPKNIKNNSSSIQWGIETAIKNMKHSPDMVFHKGDFGKEPMIIVFGKNPKNIVEKILKIL